MAYEMNDNTFDFEFSEQNIDSKFPAIKAKIKVGGRMFECAAWVRNGKYGKRISGDARALNTFLRVMFGARPPEQVQEGQMPQQQQPQPSKVQNMQNYGAAPIKDDAEDW